MKLSIKTTALSSMVESWSPKPKMKVRVFQSSAKIGLRTTFICPFVALINDKINVNLLKILISPALSDPLTTGAVSIERLKGLRMYGGICLTSN